MLENIRAIACSTKTRFLAMLGLILLAGCASTNSDKAEQPPLENVVCTAETDTFCMEGDKDKALRLNRQGLEYGAKQEYDQAQDYFQQAIELDKTNPEFYYNLGVTYSFKGMHEEEELAYMNALAIASQDPPNKLVQSHTFFNLACLYALRGDKDMAFTYLDKLYDADPGALYHQLQSDEDLKSLRDDPRFMALVARGQGGEIQSEATGKPEEASNPATASQSGELNAPAQPAKIDKPTESKKPGKKKKLRKTGKSAAPLPTAPSGVVPK